MPTFTESHARLANDVYRDQHEKPQVDITPFRRFRVIDKPSGYHGVIYWNMESDEFVVAHRGTEFDKDMLRDLVQADGQMALIALNQQLDGARETVELALALAGKGGKDGQPVPVTVTGHSLGGTLAQMTAAAYGLRSETFNAYGAAGLHGTPAGGDQVINHVRVTDMVSAAGRHFGSVRGYALEQDVDMLLSDGSLPDRQSGPQFLLDVFQLNPGKTHSIQQFHAGDRDVQQIKWYGEESIIRPENAARYEQHRTQYDAYRDNIRETALALRYGLGASALTSPHMSTLHMNLGASYLAHKAIDAFDRNEELRTLQKEAAGPDYGWRGPPAERTAPSRAGPPLRSPREADDADAYAHLIKPLGRTYGARQIESETAARGEAHPPALQSPVQVPALLPFSDPRHPLHSLYADARERLPAEYSEERVSQVTAQLREMNIKPGWNGYAMEKDGQVWLRDVDPWGQHARIDLSVPAPSVQESLQAVQQHDLAEQQRIAQDRQQEMARNQSGPAM